MKTLFLATGLFLLNCSSDKLPSEIHSQYTYGISSTFKSDTLIVSIENPLYAPLRFFIHAEDDPHDNEPKTLKKFTLKARSDTILILYDVKNLNRNIKVSTLLGAPEKEILPVEADLPFQEGKEYSVIQGNNSDFTHNTDYSRFALDFDMKTNDTVCSATDGFVVGVVDKYRSSGKSEKWTPLANFITIYEPEAGVFCQYVHIAENGSMVRVGDWVVRGREIALSGNTGRSTTGHLHFNMLIPAENSDGLISIPIVFRGGIEGKSLKKGDRLKKPAGSSVKKDK